MLNGFINSAFQLGGQYLELEAKSDLFRHQLAAQSAQAQAASVSQANQTRQLMMVGILILGGLAAYKLIK